MGTKAAPGDVAVGMIFVSGERGGCGRMEDRR